ncbi:MAG: hypothetical protein MZW92_73065 [Comamonadaceae bacterium]|nr:hypothetical protein [Comamonadaceae bacterium]
MQVRDWLYVARPLQRHPRRARARAASARPTTSAAGTRSPTSRSCTPSARCSTSCGPTPAGRYARLITLREGPPRPRPPLRHRRAQDRARTRLAPGRDLRDRHPQDGAVVPRPRRLGGQRAERRLPRLGRPPTTRRDCA